MNFDFSRVPRVALGHLPTPLEPIDRFAERIKSNCRLWIKRDDCTGLATGGNKTRKLEFLLGDALAKRADAVITFGALQSNHARQTAAACARLGLECHLILSQMVKRHDGDYQWNGNLLLDKLLGAKVHRVSPDEVRDCLDNVKRLLEWAGKTNVYVIPPGGSNGIGAIGYVACAQEIAAQTQQLGFTPQYVTHASSSCGTQAGLALGFYGTPTRVSGVNVSDASSDEMAGKIVAIAADAGTALGIVPPRIDVEVHNGFVGDGYGQPTPEGRGAIRILAETEGILIDPVYTGKALAWLLRTVRSDGYAPGGNVVFVHTGGAAALAAYTTEF